MNELNQLVYNSTQDAIKNNLIQIENGVIINKGIDVNNFDSNILNIKGKIFFVNIEKHLPITKFLLSNFKWSKFILNYINNPPQSSMVRLCRC